MPALFDPLILRGLTLRNRIGMAPMCQFSSLDGVATDWHLVHLGARAVGGAALILTEAAAVEPEGRISPFDLGLWNDAQIAPLARVTAFIRAQGGASAVQLAHAGRKAARTPGWGMDGRSRERALRPDEGAWPLSAPSALAMEGGDDFPVPAEMTIADIARVTGSFRAAAARALAAGFDAIEVHGAHGYLNGSFNSPLSNHREDGYGGSFEGRVRFSREIARAIREVWPDDRPLLFRLSATDWRDDRWTIEDTIALARLLREDGVDLIDCSSGGVAPAAIPVGPGYQVPLAAAVRRQAGIASAAVGLITEAVQAEAIVAGGEADLVLLGRALLQDPHWAQRAAVALGCPERVRLPIQNGAGWRGTRFSHAPLAVPTMGRG